MLHTVSEISPVAENAFSTVSATASTTFSSASAITSGALSWTASQFQAIGGAVWDVALAVAAFVKPFLKEVARIGLEQGERIRDFVIANKRETIAFAMGGVICSILALASLEICCGGQRDAEQRVFV